MTFKTGTDSTIGDIVAVPGNLYQYSVQGIPRNRQNIPDKIINVGSSLDTVAVGQDGEVYIGPGFNEAASQYTVSSTWRSILGLELARDIWITYRRRYDATDYGSSIVLARNNKIYSISDNGLVPGQDGIEFKTIHKLGGVTSKCILETMDGKLYGWGNGQTGSFIGSQEWTPENNDKLIEVPFLFTDGATFKSACGVFGGG